MTITHHPSDDTLAAFIRRELDEGRRVVVAAHLELCGSCRGVIAAADHVAGEQLVTLPASDMRPRALEEVLRRIGEPLPRERRERQAADDLPLRLRALGPYKLGRWRWVGPGVYRRSVGVPVEAGARVFMLKAAAGTSLPHHTHTGTELTLIIKGAFSHEGGRYEVGDFDEADGNTEHQPVVEAGEECICLVAMEGGLRLLGLAGRILQPFVRV